MCARFYHLYLDHPGYGILANTIHSVWYCKIVFTQSDIFDKLFNICQPFERIKRQYVHLPYNNVAYIKWCNLVHIYLIGPYLKSKRQQHQVGTIISEYISLFVHDNYLSHHGLVLKITSPILLSQIHCIRY